MHNRKVIRSRFGPLTNSDSDYQHTVANILNNYFSSMFDISSGLPTTTTGTSDDKGTNVNINNELPNFAITTDEVLKALQSDKTSKSPRPDKLYPQLPKETKSEIATLLTHNHFQHVLLTKHCPSGLEKGLRDRFLRRVTKIR